MRKIILHHHIFKNAGVSIDHSLHRVFGDCWLTVEGQHPFSSLSNSDLIQFLEAHPSCKSVSSHQARMIRNQLNGYEFFPIVFLRDPIDRVGSCYKYERLVNTNYHSSVAAQRGLKYYVQYCLGEGDVPRSNVISNYQTLHLSDAFNNVYDTRNLLSSDIFFHQAVHYLDSLSCFGLVEKFSQSLKLFESWLIQHFPGVIFNDLKLNSSQRASLLSERVEDMRQELGNKLYDLLLERNLDDQRLYNYACKKFDQLEFLIAHKHDSKKSGTVS